MYGLMNEISDTYTKRLLEYADKQEIFDIKVYVYLLYLLFKVEFYFNDSVNGQYTLDNIASCLFGIETNSLQNENVTLINHLKSFFKVNLASLFILVLRKCISIKISNLIFIYCCFLIRKIVISPRLAKYLTKKGYSMVPYTAVNYITNIVNQILTRRREYLERRNDFIQIMVDHEKEIKDEEQTSQEIDKQKQGWGTLSKSTNKLFSVP
jgi:hypothetical protein